MKCDVCGEDVDESDGGGVAAIPGMPMSIYYCSDCIAKGITHPYWALVVNTAMIGGLEHAAEWWTETVTKMVPLLGMSMQEFGEDVEIEIQAQREIDANMPPLEESPAVELGEPF